MYCVAASAEAPLDTGITRITSTHSVAQTMERLESLLKERGVMIFARIDFSGDAARAGLSLRPEQLLIFGNPKAGTPLMIASPTIAIDLPLKLLVWEDASGKTRISYNDPKYLKERHDVPQDLVQNIAAAGMLAAEGANGAQK